MTTQQAKNIIAKIKQEKITPFTYIALRWKGYVFWILWICIMIIGAISFSLLILNVLDIRMEFFLHMGLGRYMRILFMTAPYLWFGLALIAMASGFVALRRTHRGYRYSMLFATSMSVLIITLFGFIVHIAKINDHIGKRMADGGVPRGMVFPMEDRWGNPERGIVGGRIVSIKDHMIILSGFHEEQWKISFDDDTYIEPLISFEEGMLIEVIGTDKTENGIFYATFIRILPDHMPRPFEDLPEVRNDKRDMIKYEKIVPLVPQDAMPIE